MSDNTATNVSEKKSVFTIKKIMRVLALLCIIFAFCPSFLVSCSGQDMKVNVMTAVKGVSMYGDKVVEPHIIMIVCLLIPIAVLVLLFIKKFNDKQTAGIILGCVVVDFIVWLIFRSSVKKLAEQNYCTFKTTGWYVINIIVMLFMIVLSVLVVINKMAMDTDLTTVFSSSGTKDAAIGFCSKCGTPISHGSKFCSSCGTPVPESLPAEAEEAKKATEDAAGKDTEE